MLRLIEISEGGAAILPGGDLPDMVIDLCLAYDRLYQERGFMRPWLGYLAVRDGKRGAEIVGSCGFRGPPRDGRVEISFLTFLAFEKQGVATAMARELAGIAEGADDRHVRVYARTPPYDSEASRVLHRAGFIYDTEVNDPEDGPVWEWVLG